MTTGTYIDPDQAICPRCHTSRPLWDSMDGTFYCLACSWRGGVPFEPLPWIRKDKEDRASRLRVTYKRPTA